MSKQVAQDITIPAPLCPEPLLEFRKLHRGAPTSPPQQAHPPFESAPVPTVTDYTCISREGAARRGWLRGAITLWRIRKGKQGKASSCIRFRQKMTARCSRSHLSRGGGGAESIWRNLLRHELKGVSVQS